MADPYLRRNNLFFPFLDLVKCLVRRKWSEI